MNHHLKNIIVASGSAIPYVGGPISVLLNEYIPDNLQKQRDKLIEEISSDLVKIKERLDNDFLGSKDFALFFIRIFNKAMIENNKIKSKIFKTILQKIALQEYKIDLETEMFMKLVEDLVTHQLYIIYSINNDGKIYKTISYFADKKYEKYSLVGLENFGLIEKLEQNSNYTKYGLTKLGESFYTFIDLEQIYNEIIEEIHKSR